MSSVEQKRILDHYEPRVSKNREKFDMLDWGNREAQLKRFQVLAEVLKKILPSASPQAGDRLISLLDAGCGFAELAEFLHSRQLPVDYTGIDLCTGFITAAAASRPSLDLVIGDVFREPLFQTNSFDLVVCSGALNLASPAHDEFIRLALASMLALCRNCLAVNFLHARTADKYVHCHYYQPEEAIALLPTNTGLSIKVFDDYLENDFTLAVYKQSR